MTDSKRTTQERLRLLLGKRKSLRYHPTPPAKDASLSSPAFQAFGTATRVQPAVPVSFCGPLWRLSSLRSQVPSMRKRPEGPFL